MSIDLYVTPQCTQLEFSFVLSLGLVTGEIEIEDVETPCGDWDFVFSYTGKGNKSEEEESVDFRGTFIFM